MKDIRQIIFWWLATLLWFGVIYYFSNQPDLKSQFLPSWDLVLRKIAHLAEFFVLAYLFFRAYQSVGFSKIKSLIFALMFSVLGAVFDEWHQSFISGRVASITDILIDSIGALGFSVLQFNHLRK
ncbi:MAG: VanZ family protein [Candidatus Buchananbacteria bacterium]|nr:VanZ family protein [Candidatus Buchananbacteria bacterium]